MNHLLSHYSSMFLTVLILLSVFVWFLRGTNIEMFCPQAELYGLTIYELQLRGK